MTVYQNDLEHPTFDIVFDPDNEVKYEQILNHPDNQFKQYMAATFADQPMGVYDYVVEFNDIAHSATIQQSADLSARLAPGLSARLARRLADLKASG